MKIGILIADPEFKNLNTDKNLYQIYGESILQITYHKLKPFFDKIIVVVSSFDQVPVYSRFIQDEVVVNLEKSKNEVTAALTAFRACKKIPGADLAFVLRVNMPLVSLEAVNLFFQNAQDFSAVVSKQANNFVEPFHAVYRINSMLNALEKASNDERRLLYYALTYLDNIYYLPTAEIIKLDPQLNTFFRVESGIDFQKAKEKLQGKTYKGRIKKAKKIAVAIEKSMETQSTIYFKAPGTEETHELMYNKRTKKWNCDCRHYVMRATQCSHIIAAQAKI